MAGYTKKDISKLCKGRTAGGHKVFFNRWLSF